MNTPQSGREALDLDAAMEAFDDVFDGENRRAALQAAVQAALAQQGREVGEVWKVRVFPVAVNGEDDAHRVEMKRGVQSFSVGPDYWDTREEAEAYAGQLRIALAAPKQQAVAWHPVIAELHAHMSHCLSAADEDVDYGCSRGVLDALTTLRLMEKCGRGKWRPTEYGESFVYGAPKQQAVEVTEEMVDAASGAFYDCYEGPGSIVRECIRAALLAALPGKTEVDRG